MRKPLGILLGLALIIGGIVGSAAGHYIYGGTIVAGLFILLRWWLGRDQTGKCYIVADVATPIRESSTVMVPISKVKKNVGDDYAEILSSAERRRALARIIYEDLYDSGGDIGWMSPAWEPSMWEGWELVTNKRGQPHHLAVTYRES